jgi:hypothetical protein
VRNTEGHPVISSWLAKVVIGVGLLVFLIIELSSPVITRAQLGDTATETARAAASTITRGGDANDARKAADVFAHDHNAGVEEFTVTGDQVKLRVSREAHSFLLGRLKQAERWYHVTARATAVVRP